MRELSPQRVSEDGRFLVARDDASAELFALRLGHRLTSLIDSAGLGTATSRDRGQLEITMESSLSPRDIQTRIRRGESPAEVAGSAGVPVEQIIGFATPILAEREYMCEQARKTTVRREHAPSAIALGQALAQTGTVADSAQWDSWRREDGRWTVTMLPAGSDCPATFLFDVQSRYVLAGDARARELIGDIPTVEHDMAIADAIRDVPAPAPAPVAAPAADEGPAAPVHSLKEVRDRKALEQLALGLDTDEEPVTDRVMESRPEVDAETVDEPRAKRQHERRRVPSWDEIMFGGAKQ